MAASLSVELMKGAVARVGAKMEEVADELNSLDAALGDGDLGVTMVRGTRAILADLDTFPADDIGAALLKCAQGFTKTSGSTFGTLVATGLMAMARRTKGEAEISWRDLAPLLDEALAAMSSRGKAELGDKTVLDALDAVRRGIEGHDDPSGMAAAALREMRETLDRLREEPARQGRARIFADRSIGRDDPGMIAVQRVVEGLA